MQTGLRVRYVTGLITQGSEAPKSLLSYGSLSPKPFNHGPVQS